MDKFLKFLKEILRDKKFLTGLLLIVIFSCFLIIGIYFYLNQSLSMIKLFPKTEVETEPKPGFSHMSAEQIEQILESMTPKSTTTATTSE